MLKKGISYNLPCATLADLEPIFGVPLDTMLYLPLAISCGFVLGSTVGWTYQFGLNRQIILIVFTTVQAVSICILPEYGTFSLAIIGTAFYGIGIGVWDASVTYWLLEMWQQDSAFALMMHQFMFATGTIASILILDPYLLKESKIGFQNVTTSERINIMSVPYAITGGLSCIVPLLLLILFFYNRYYSPAEIQAKLDHSKTGDLVLSPAHEFKLETEHFKLERTSVTGCLNLPSLLPSLLFTCLLSTLGYIFLQLCYSI